MSYLGYERAAPRARSSSISTSCSARIENRWLTEYRFVFLFERRLLARLPDGVSTSDDMAAGVVVGQEGAKGSRECR